MSAATGRGHSENSSLKAGAGGARLFLFGLIAVLAGVAYATFSGFTEYQQLNTGRGELVAAQAGFSAATQSADVAGLAAVSAQLRRGERDFSAAQERSAQDPAFAVARTISPLGQQIDGTSHLAAIGADISRAGQSAVAIALQVAALKQRYAGQALTSENLPALLTQAEAIASTYGASATGIAAQLRAAHAERAAVSTTSLAPPIRDAYAEVDAALAQADSAFARYQDLRRLLAEALGVALP